MMTKVCRTSFMDVSERVRLPWHLPDIAKRIKVPRHFPNIVMRKWISLIFLWHSRHPAFLKEHLTESEKHNYCTKYLALHNKSNLIPLPPSYVFVMTCQKNITYLSAVICMSTSCRTTWIKNKAEFISEYMCLFVLRSNRIYTRIYTIHPSTSLYFLNEPQR